MVTIQVPKILSTIMMMITMMIITKTINILYLRTQLITQSLTSQVFWTTFLRLFLIKTTRTTGKQSPEEATDQDTRTGTNSLVTGHREEDHRHRTKLIMILRR